MIYRNRSVGFFLAVATLFIPSMLRSEAALYASSGSEIGFVMDQVASGGQTSTGSQSTGTGTGAAADSAAAAAALGITGVPAQTDNSASQTQTNAPAAGMDFSGTTTRLTPTQTDALGQTQTNTPGSTLKCTPSPAGGTQTCVVLPTSDVSPTAKPQTAVATDAMRQTEAAARAAAAQSAQQKLTEEPQQIRNRVPYANIPALRDLYTQVPAEGATLRRFGSDAFLFGTGNAEQLPSDLPAGPDYVLGPGDQLTVNMWGARSERLSITVDRQGQLSLPEAGTVVVNGLTIAKAQEAIQRALNTQFKDEHAEISLGRLRTVRVYVVGDVQRPGAYDVSSLATPLSVLYAAGGPTARGSLRLMKVMRGDQEVAKVDLYDFLLKGVRSSVERLQPGDTLLVPSVGPQVTVEGSVHHPAIYELNGENSLDKVLDLAGGILSTASLKQIEVSRVDANTRRTMLSLELPASTDGVKAALAGFHVQGADDVVISSILPYNQQAVYLAGHVFRPGQYAYRDGMTLTDVLRSYQDILPEPAVRGQIVRLAAPDFHPDTIPFNLPEVLMGNAPIRLQPFDTVEVFGRYEADAPIVTIEGQVLKPGKYPLPVGMTVSGLINLAGGFDRSAFRDIAGLTNYSVVNGQSIQLGHMEVDLNQAMAGNKQADTVLKPGDVLSIRQITGWSDIGASITVAGEVAHPGGYGLVDGERLSSVIKRAGGFRPEAYPEASNFNRIQVQVLAEKAREEMIQRIETSPIEAKPGGTDSDSQQMVASLQQQRIQTLAALRANPATGRMVVNISGDISKWENTSADVILRAGDTITIPKRPNFVLIAGQVFNPTAVSFVPGHNAGWYLNKGGGATRYGDPNRIYVLRADGSVVAHDGFGRSVHHVNIRPGDAVVVPAKLFGTSEVWRDIIAAAQLASSFALTAVVALR